MVAIWIKWREQGPLVVDGPQSSLEPRKQVVGASEASVPSWSRSPPMHEVLYGYSGLAKLE